MRDDENDPVIDGQDRLAQIASSLKNGEAVEPVTVRELLRWFGAKRRGPSSWLIGMALESNDLRTEPYFEDHFLNGLIEFRLGRAHRYKTVSDLLGAEDDEHDTAATSHSPVDASANVVAFPGRDSTSRNLTLITDPTFRVGRLPAANSPPTCVAPNSSLIQATTKMLINDFSQLPVINGAPKASNVKRVISWHSIGMRHALGLSFTEVRE